MIALVLFVSFVLAQGLQQGTVSSPQSLGNKRPVGYIGCAKDTSVPCGNFKSFNLVCKTSIERDGKTIDITDGVCTCNNSACSQELINYTIRDKVLKTTDGKSLTSSTSESKSTVTNTQPKTISNADNTNPELCVNSVQNNKLSSEQVTKTQASNSNKRDSNNQGTSPTNCLHPLYFSGCANSPMKCGDFGGIKLVCETKNNPSGQCLCGENDKECKHAVDNKVIQSDPTKLPQFGNFCKTDKTCTGHGQICTGKGIYGNCLQCQEPVRCITNRENHSQCHSCSSCLLQNGAFDCKSICEGTESTSTNQTPQKNGKQDSTVTTQPQKNQHVNTTSKPNTNNSFTNSSYNCLHPLNYDGCALTKNKCGDFAGFPLVCETRKGNPNGQCLCADNDHDCLEAVQKHTISSNPKVKPQFAMQCSAVIPCIGHGQLCNENGRHGNCKQCQEPVRCIANRDNHFQCHTCSSCREQNGYFDCKDIC